MCSGVGISTLLARRRPPPNQEHPSFNSCILPCDLGDCCLCFLLVKVKVPFLFLQASKSAEREPCLGSPSPHSTPLQREVTSLRTSSWSCSLAHKCFFRSEPLPTADFQRATMAKSAGAWLYSPLLRGTLCAVDLRGRVCLEDSDTTAVIPAARAVDITQRHFLMTSPTRRTAFSLSQKVSFSTLQGVPNFGVLRKHPWLRPM